MPNDTNFQFPLLKLPNNRVRRNYQGGSGIDFFETGEYGEDNGYPEDWVASTVEARNPGLEPVPDEGLATIIDEQGNQHLLRDLFRSNGEYYLGKKHLDSLGTELGFLAKFLDSSMRLHVQAHPTAKFAQQHLNSRYGKLETYVILAIREGCSGYLRLGFQHCPGEEEWKRIVFEQDIKAMDACFEPVPVQVGEVYVVPGGIPHAIGEGLLVIEVMEPTDLVVRCEYEREGIVVPPEARFMGRDPEFAMKIFEYQENSIEDIKRKFKIQPQVIQKNENYQEELLIGPEQTDCFQIIRKTITGEHSHSGTGKVGIYIVTDGEGSIEVDDVKHPAKKGERFLIAAAAELIQYQSANSGKALELVYCCPG